MRSWKAFMELRAQQRAALQQAFDAVTASERRTCKGAMLHRWRDVTAQAAQVGMSMLAAAACGL